MILDDYAEPERFQAEREADLMFIGFVWGLIDVPAALIGCCLGYSADKIEVPVKISRVHRSLPTEVPFYAKRRFTLVVGSMLIAACLVCEAYFLMSTLWRHQYYFMYLYLLVCFGLTTYVAMTASIVQTYLSLSAGDYRWWWRSYLIGFCGGIHIYVVCTYLFLQEEGQTFSLELSAMLWSLAMCTLVGLITGNASFAASYFFIKRIYTKASFSK